MGYTNSPLVSYTKISPNRTKNRTHVIDTITIHCVVGQCSVETLGSIFEPESRQASSNYGIGSDGRVGMYVEEKDRSWCSSNAANDHRAITIEVASDTTHPYAVNEKAYATLIDLCVDICQRNSIKQLLWKADKSLIGQVDKQNMTAHRWFANKACPGDYLSERFGAIAAAVNERLGATGGSTSRLQATEFNDLTEAQVIAKVGSLFTADQKKSGILASVSLAQFILESGYGKSELAQNANNCFGMKKSLSGNTWSGSTWDGTSVYTKQTQEQNTDGSYETITADFRKYGSVEDSIADHSAYLLGAKNGSALRYAGIAGMIDYKVVAQLVKDGGYATSLTYVENLCSIIEKWNLTQYDVTADADEYPEQLESGYYRVRKEWSDNKSQLGAYRVLPNAKKKADENPGYSVFTEDGKVIYPVATETTTPASFEPYTVKVSISDMNIRKGPGTDYAKTGQFTGKGVFTIVAESTGAGASLWGKLKSGAGWISLDFAEKQ